ncbi:anti sigma factor C-terminal domain-containing protein [Paenibacillus lautus]|uniref:anti sigma factor C-terminal domain-containing protein n=1 Tax=Paenibacillus lautus TaxID=1401 RepID=UPI003D29BEC9
MDTTPHPLKRNNIEFCVIWNRYSSCVFLAAVAIFNFTVTFARLNRCLHHFLSSWHTFFSLDAGITDHEQQLIADVEWMTNNIKYNGVDDDKHRLAYLKKNGVQVYGGTVTGPVRELEKLKEEQEFWEFRLGRIEVWNWS